MKSGVSLREALATAVLLGLAGCNDGAVEETAGSVTVFESSGRQCEARTTPQQSGLKLIQQGLDVQRSGCGVMKERAFPAVCGAESPLINLHVIPAVSLDAAERTGFRNAASLEKGYDWLDCETGKVLP